ncbi:hypothetical protein C6N40_11890 [Arenimonas caeni]|uniref:Uncharacterized protein n=1 Tax=Arenimonas caeni TaxID=2058085 RepID=A0A2P6M6A9_9GAMM|nr:hypothetical protein C6N40_11890 [Arenimonas caeni]
MNAGSTVRCAGLLLVGAAALSGCGPGKQERWDSGYDDGYASGYNTTCEIRATMIAGTWDDEAYSAGYREGYADGAAECKRRAEE